MLEAERIGAGQRNQAQLSPEFTHPLTHTHTHTRARARTFDLMCNQLLHLMCNQLAHLMCNQLVHARCFRSSNFCVTLPLPLAKTCNLLGNLCRHSSFFYKVL